MAKTGTNVVSWDEQMAELAKKFKGTVASISTGKMLSFKGGIMSAYDSPVDGNELDVIVLDYVLENVFYEGKFDADNPASPVCYAFGREAKDLKPHDEVEEKQSTEGCGACEHNEWGSGEGRGKACKNQVRLAVIPADTKMTAAGIAESDMLFAKVPVTSVKGFAAYAAKINDTLRKPTFCFVTNIKLVPDKKDQFKVVFTPKIEVKDKAILSALFTRFEAAGKAIEFPYSKPSEQEQKPGRSKSKTKTAAKGARKKY